VILFTDSLGKNYVKDCSMKQFLIDLDAKFVVGRISGAKRLVSVNPSHIVHWFEED
jgi:hypothetical protein